jgi:DNA-directed RNA polymerase subunit M/transcription elongation factor TFIIS
MLTVKGRRKCDNCGKRYNYYYSKIQDEDKKLKYKGKDENASECTNVKVLSVYTYEVTVNCPECGFEEVFVYTD